MTLVYSTDTTAAAWLAGTGTPPGRLITFGPAGFEAYARLRFIADPVRPGMEEADVDLPDDHLHDLQQADRALRLLAAFTTTPRDCWFLGWDGSPDIRPPAGVPLIDLPGRGYYLLHGALTDLGDWPDLLPPAFAWPADRSWCFTADVDPHWAGIGATRPAIAALLTDPVLDVTPADPSADQPHYGPP